MIEEKKDRITLSELFAPPTENHKGTFGVMCSLSADDAYMDKLLEYFTGLDRNQREFSGHCSLMMFIDPRNKPIILPGLGWAHPNTSKWKDNTKLLHAKTALLGFGESKVGESDYYRLIVFTGNWTEESVNNSINLLWYCDYDVNSKESQQQQALDISEAMKFWEYLLGENENNLFIVDNVLRKKLYKFFGELTKKIIIPQRGYTPNFISNLKPEIQTKQEFFTNNSIGKQFIDYIKKDATRRNFICCGSGFFEEIYNKKNVKEPEVLSKLVEQLKNGDLLASTIEEFDGDGDKINKWLVINPNTSGAAGWWFKNSKKENLSWLLHKAKYPGDKKHFQPTFHAKYIYIANQRDVESFSNGILYLGSANLSKQGFSLAPGSGGNIEVGVFCNVEERFTNEELCEKLGINSEEMLKKEMINEELTSEETEVTDYTIPESPIIFSCEWDKKTKILSWEWANDKEKWYNIKINENPINTDQNQICIDRPGYYVKITAANKSGILYVWELPVFNSDGKFIMPIIYHKTISDIIESIIDFPPSFGEGFIAIGEDEEGEDEGFIFSADDTEQMEDIRQEYKSASLHSASLLVETIAEQNQKITSGQMADWVDYLRRMLIDSIDNKTADSFRSLGINFMQPLIDEPGFAPDNITKEYKELILEVIDIWGLTAGIMLSEKEGK